MFAEKSKVKRAKLTALSTGLDAATACVVDPNAAVVHVAVVNVAVVNVAGYVGPDIYM